MTRRPPRSTLDRSSAASDVYKRQPEQRHAYKACRCSGVVRVDFIVTPEGKPYMIEINSIPGMSAGSIVPKQAKAMGMTLGEMFDLVIADTCRK